jgi:putative transposase
MALPQGPNQRWSLNFLSDAFAGGRRFCILAIVDDFSRECLALVADTITEPARIRSTRDSSRRWMKKGLRSIHHRIVHHRFARV